MALGSGPDEGRPAGLPGRYEQQHLDVAARVMTDLDVPWRLVFQSRSGPPQVPWLEPDINDAIREEAAAGRRAVIVVPIGFVSDHVEVVWDLDHEGADTAAEVGIAMIRVPTPGIDPDFVAALGDAIQEACDGAAPVSALCSTTCCTNARGEQPTIPGLARPQ
jgi:ferrochelatase